LISHLQPNIMAEATNRASVQGLFDDDDSSSSDEEMPSTQQPPPAEAPTTTTTGEATADTPSAGNDNSAVSNNAQLFGSDSDDSEDGDDGPTASASAPSGDADADATKDKLKKSSGAADSDDDDEDIEFKADDITGKKAVLKPQTFSQADVAAARRKTARHITVPDMPLPQFENGGGPKTTFHMAQLPKIITIQSDCYNRDSYNASVEEAQFRGSSTGHSSMIRWRYKRDDDGEYVLDDNGKKIKESNAKIIKWSDGTYGLCVGDEVFNMNENSFNVLGAKGKTKGQMKGAPPGGPNAKEQQAKANANAATKKKFKSKDFIYLTQKAKAINDEDGTSEPIGTILQCVTSLTSKFIPRPASLQSEAHKRFVLRERKKILTKRAQIAEHVTFEDPEKLKAERIRHKDDLMKQAKRSGGGRRSTGGGGGRRRYGMSRSYLEDDDDEHYDSVNIRSLKRGTMNDDDMDYGDDDDLEDEWSKRKRKRSRKSDFDEDEDEDEDEAEQMVVDDDDDDEEEQFAVRKRNNGRTETKKNAAIFDDSDSD